MSSAATSVHGGSPGADPPVLKHKISFSVDSLLSRSPPSCERLEEDQDEDVDDEDDDVDVDDDDNPHVPTAASAVSSSAGGGQDLDDGESRTPPPPPPLVPRPMHPPPMLDGLPWGLPPLAWLPAYRAAPNKLDRQDPPNAFVVMFSVIDKASFQKAEDEPSRLMDWELLRTRSAILVGNKVDLVRSRAVSAQDGKCLACTYRAKFIEISVGISHNVDELLVGILNQIRLKILHTVLSDLEGSTHWYKSKGVIRASMKARWMFTWLFGKEDSKFKNCENLHVL